MPPAGCWSGGWRTGRRRARWAGKGSYAPWSTPEFAEYESREAGKKRVVHKLAERPLTLSNDFEVREVRCLTEDGHQTSIVTIRTELSMLAAAERRFSGWRQKNFFRYMHHEFDLDHLPTYAAEPGDLERLVPNPAKKEKKKELDTLRDELGRRKQEYGKPALEGSANSAAEREELRARIGEGAPRVRPLQEEHRALPGHVPVGQLRDPKTVVQLEYERKTHLDQIKMVAYRAETELAQIVGPLVGHLTTTRPSPSCGRSLSYRPTSCPIPRPAHSTSASTAWPTGTPNCALAELCHFLNAYDTCYPGTELRLVLEAPASEQ